MQHHKILFASIDCGIILHHRNLILTPTHSSKHMHLNNPHHQEIDPIAQHSNADSIFVLMTIKQSKRILPLNLVSHINRTTVEVTHLSSLHWISYLIFWFMSSLSWNFKSKYFNYSKKLFPYTLLLWLSFAIWFLYKSPRL